MRGSFLALAALALALAACSRAEPKAEPAPAAPPPPALTDAEIFERFQLLIPRLKECFRQAPAGGKFPRTARVSFSYQSSEEGLVKEATVVKANFRFRELAPCLEKPLIGLQLDPAAGEERRISLKIELGTP